MTSDQVRTRMRMPPLPAARAGWDRAPGIHSDEHRVPDLFAFRKSCPVSYTSLAMSEDGLTCRRRGHEWGACVANVGKAVGKVGNPGGSVNFWLNAVDDLEVFSRIF
jgi:hypothetical protein